MRNIGKILGFLVGGLMLGPFGSVAGLLVGHFLDLGRGQDQIKKQVNQLRGARKIFFQTTFSVMGYLAKVDGRVSEKEIQVAREIMSQLGLNHTQKLRAMHFFNYGKSSDFGFNQQIDEFYEHCGAQPYLVELFMEIQLKSILADNHQNQYKQYALKQICQRLNFSNRAIESLLYQYQSEQAYQQRKTTTRSAQDELSAAYIRLGVSMDTDNKDVKKAYKKLVSQNHPDKLVAKGLPEEMVKMATEKMQKIQNSYDLICKAHGIK
jgi:DnaJ like chaperone protein